MTLYTVDYQTRHYNPIQSAEFKSELPIANAKMAFEEKYGCTVIEITDQGAFEGEYPGSVARVIELL